MAVVTRDLPLGIAALPLDQTEAGPCGSEEVEVRVLLFSVLRDLVGTGDLTLRLPVPARGEDLIDWLSIDYPALRVYRAVTRIAVNEAYVPPFTELRDGDEIALITPVSGG